MSPKSTTCIRSSKYSRMEEARHCYKTAMKRIVHVTILRKNVQHSHTPLLTKLCYGNEAFSAKWRKHNFSNHAIKEGQGEMKAHPKIASSRFPSAELRTLVLPTFQPRGYKPHSSTKVVIYRMAEFGLINIQIPYLTDLWSHIYYFNLIFKLHTAW